MKKSKSNLYTGGGDPIYTEIEKTIRSKTSLYGGKKRSKADFIFSVLGKIDSCNSLIGMLAANLDYEGTPSPRTKYKSELLILRDVQGKLQTIASHIASVSDKNKKRYSLCSEDVVCIESKIDTYDKKCPKLTAFILPGAGRLDSMAHHCRSEIRSLERKMYLLSEQQASVIREVKIFTYINRLSDFLFALARYLTVSEGLKDVVME
jgi:cob(I)alamin adenosyltransferase